MSLVAALKDPFNQRTFLFGDNYQGHGADGYMYPLKTDSIRKVRLVYDGNGRPLCGIGGIGLACVTDWLEWYLTRSSQGQNSGNFRRYLESQEEMSRIASAFWKHCVSEREYDLASGVENGRGGIRDPGQTLILCTQGGNLWLWGGSAIYSHPKGVAIGYGDDTFYGYVMCAKYNNLIMGMKQLGVQAMEAAAQVCSFVRPPIDVVEVPWSG